MTEEKKLDPAPKFLMLFPTYAYGEAPMTYGFISFSTREDVTSFFSEMRAHLKAAVDLVKSTTKVRENPIGEFYAHPNYDTLEMSRHALGFFKLYPDGDFEEKFRGVEDFETLVQLAATNIVRPNEDVALTLSVEDSMDEAPVVIDFHDWHNFCVVGGHFKGSVDEFWNELLELAARVEGDRTEIHFPISLKVLRAGPTPVFENFEDKIRVVFRSRIKHSDQEELVTTELSLPEFIGVYEDALMKF